MKGVSANARETASGRPGVILMNMGGPADVASIRPYLKGIFSDPKLVRLPAGFLYQWLFSRLVAWVQTPKVAERYKAIGGSPLLRETMLQAEALERALGLPVAIGMRYSAPSAADAVAALLSQGVSTIVGLSMYPQYSSATTGSCIANLKKAVRGRAELRLVDRHYAAPGLVRTLANGLRDAVGKLEQHGEVHVLFTAHNLPVWVTLTGDPYVEEVEKTAAAVEAEAGLGLPWSVAYQSAAVVGKWLSPTLDEALSRLVAARASGVVVVPLSFATENLETLYTLDIEFNALCRSRGVPMLARVRAPGAAPYYIESLAHAVRAALRAGNDGT